MYDKLFEPAKKLFGIIGASATGITAVFYVFGFLVVQQHFSFLGLTHISIDFNNYLFAGGRFFAYFPVLLIHLIDMFLKYFSRYPQWFIPGFLGLIFLFLLSQIPSVRALRKRAMLRVRGHIQNKLVFYLLLTNGLFLWLFLTYSLEIVIQKNWLFKDSPSGMEWLITPSTDASGMRQAVFARLFFIAIISTTVLVFLESLRLKAKQDEEQHAAHSLRFALVCSGLFLVILQVLYLPVNYGILIYSKEYPVVQFELNNAIIPELAAKPKVSLIHQEKEDIYIYSLHEKRVWQIKRNEIKWLTRMGQASVFDYRAFDSDITRKE